jgi:hypothetical protein
MWPPDAGDDDRSTERALCVGSQSDTRPRRVRGSLCLLPSRQRVVRCAGRLLADRSFHSFTWRRCSDGSCRRPYRPAGGNGTCSRVFHIGEPHRVLLVSMVASW